MLFDCWNVHWTENVLHLQVIRSNETSEEFDFCHYSDVIMGAMASEITGVKNVDPTVCSGTSQRKHQSSASLAFVRGIHRWQVNSPHTFKGPVRRKCFHLMTSSWYHQCGLMAFKWGRFHRMLKVIILDMSLEIINLRLQSHLPRVMELIYAHHKKQWSSIFSAIWTLDYLCVEYRRPVLSSSGTIIMTVKC